MDDYSTLAALISSSILVVMSFCYFFGRFFSQMEVGERDKYVYIINGFSFLLDYARFPLTIIACLEIFMRNTKDIFSITLPLIILILFQAAIPLIIMRKFKRIAPVARFIFAHKDRVYIHSRSDKVPTFGISIPLIHMMVFVEIVLLYLFIRIYLTRHIFFLNVNLPAYYRLEVYVILSSMITFISLMSAKIIETILMQNISAPAIIQMDNGSEVEGVLWTWGKFSEIHTNENILYVNMDKIKVVKKKYL